MPIALTDDHSSLADVARSFATGDKLRTATRAMLDATPSGDLPASWQRIVDLGWPGIHLPEEFGGGGAGLGELAVVVEQLGAAVAGGPFLPAVIGSAVIATVGTDQLKADLLPALAGGSAIAAFAVASGVTIDDGTATGSAVVIGGLWAQHLLLAVGDDLVVVSAGSDAVGAGPADALDPSLGVATVQLTAAPAQVVAGAAAASVAVARAIAAAEAAGGAQATLGLALEYAKVREQFGRAIGSFQAVKHHLANMLVASEQATAVAWDAARAARHTDGQSELAGAIAGSVALEAYVHNAQMNIQVHGGIGFTWEHDAHLYLRRALTLRAAYGHGSEAEVYRLASAGVTRDSAVELPPEAEGFRAEARAFATTMARTPEADRRALLVESGYLVPHWPAPYGRAAGPIEQLVLEQEFRSLTIPNLGIGGWVLLTLVQQASPEQLDRWILPALRGQDKWCQLFSEPNAGSDAAAVQTRAVRAEGGWRVTGQKVWTSDAQTCNKGLATVRTNPSAAKHKGITTVVVDLHAEGVEVRPLREITGDAIFNEVFFDDVFIPDADVVGEVDGGWTVARATLGNERVSIGGGFHMATNGYTLLNEVAERAEADPSLPSRLGRLIADEGALHALNLRHVERAVVGGAPGAEGNITKLLTAEHMQAVTEFAMSMLGVAGVDGSHFQVTQEYLADRSMTIAGGTSEVSRNVIAERLLGLPREAIAN